jgi:hypothetical protein
MGRCNQGIKFCSKIQSARNHFKSNESIGLIIANSTQLVWVQTDVGSERYHILFKMPNRQKRDVDCTVRIVHMNNDVVVHMDDDVVDHTDDMAGYTLMWQTVIGQLAYDVFCWQ